jgi:hypothetical protein
LAISPSILANDSLLNIWRTPLNRSGAQARAAVNRSGG